MSRELKFETLAAHAGQDYNDTFGSRGVPVYKTTSYLFRDSKHAADLFDLKELGYIYTRLGDPTADILEKRITAMEGGKASIAVSSGTNAIFYTIITICEAGDEIVSAFNVYGGTYSQFGAILPKLGINTKFVDAKDPENFAKAITDKTKLIFIETISNPSLDFTDIEAVAKIAHNAGIPLVIDGTFTTPYLLQTIKHGGDIVINSLTKWIGGHGSAVGGIITDGGNFNWQSDKFPLFSKPDANYHGLRWAYDLPDELKNIAFALRVRTVPLRNLGACLSPDNSWIFIQGTESLAVRMDRHCSNALKVAEFLEKDDRVEWVRYPGLKNDPSYATASKYLKDKFGGMVVFGIKGGYEAAVKFIDNIKLFSHLVNVGDVKSLVAHPASTTHSQLSEEELKKGGISKNFIRLSIGIEHIDDILYYLDEALTIANK
ncbi:O-acetylhomoserine aminocarboxypropyltransferase/cysteine synthase family protein [Brachyspira hyodysenteriae]|uniref:O-acetylhomoserine aminocarboxypropyltransferase/cysteine synthase family protein n=1 Tax=Brachyspira hyodysenteriae TaxID=159 RepID=UPI00063DC019|nr:O-acetylhomoserine aminocarboxypropyltransferase/cysteine synthase family protein [Brachyspira hyodysenteriae]KLI52992.1 O-acetylhomoserine aminocarboxypropyltransferase [Brachyspira hyodysenteriae]MCZ9938940.1 O-acetylhomoserine aminocarboxypropyltransferase/cysteine synthase [Brachyspira hyodysenteriae]MDA0054572.1 O-acetylhomoserine aminocarboxypropyltransferase/cysteine synthase [Brachyspira hyodysenteriae]TVL72259.1 O-acetylhomoserine aminocarboxypropyltransferase [Brachyspira hyodysent